MKPEWSGNPAVGPTLMIYGLAGLAALVLLVIAFAYTW